MSAPYNLRMFDILGAPLDRFHATFNCTWANGEWGTAEWSMACTDAKATRRNFEFGRYVLFDHARLGKWGGVITPHDGMSGTWENTVAMRARSAEYQFSRRHAPLYGALDNTPASLTGTPGELVRQIIALANEPGDSLLRPGSIDTSGEERGIFLRDANLRDMLDNITKRSGFVWWCEPYTENGYLRFAVNFAQTRGVNSGYSLRERINIRKRSGDLWRRQVDMVNDARVVGGNGDAYLKARATSINRLSCDAYGIWQGADTVEEENTDVAQSRADALVAEQGEPKYELLLEVIENRQSADTFAHIGIGDTVFVRIDNARFFGEQQGIRKYCRILTREYSTKANACMLTVEVL